MNKRLLLSLFGIVFSMMVMAITTPEKGKYYRIVNLNPEKASNVEGVSEPYAISENKTTHGLSTVAQDDDSKTRYGQIWYCTTAGTKVAFQNARTKRYIGSVSKSTQVLTSAASVTHALTDKTTYFLVGTGDAMWHSDGSNNVVGWNDASNTSNHWDFQEVTVDSTILVSVQESYAKEQAEKSALEAIAAKASTYGPIILGYFNDYACTDMKAEYSSMTDADFQSKMTTDGLPEAVQTIVLRIKNKWSDELDATQSEKFRIQKYTCYPHADEAKAYTKATQISDMNNITGIWTNALQLLYIFVDSDIPSNATLKIAQTTGDQGRAWYSQGTTLQKGLNIVYCGTDLANNWIMYTVPFSNSKPIASYPKIKIHIEGGNVIGYMNTLDADGNILPEDECNANWKIQLKYANAIMKQQGYTDLSSDRIDYAVKGQRGMLFFPVECYNRIWATTPYNAYYKTNYNIYKSMRFFDNVLRWEWGAMGITKRIVDGEGAPSVSRENMEGGYDIQPTYVNNLACGMMIWEGGKNPYSSDGYTSMPGVGAVESSYNAERADFDVWCVGHESGHNNQGTINLPSSMESSNNTFSNICQYQNGYRLSRGMTFMENMDYITSKTLFPQRSISMTLRMYFNLYLYYHRAGYNTKFYPTLHKMLRDDAMYFGGEGWWEGVGDGNGGANMGSATTSWLKFYEKACDAAQEDLTEYFRMWGFFIPSKDAQYGVYNSNNKRWFVYCGDYSSYYIENSQAMIDAAIKRVKAKKYPENKQIMFVEDRLVPQPRFDAWAPDGKNSDSSTAWKVTTDGSDASNETTLKSWYGDLGYIGYYEKDNMKIATADDYTYVATGTSVKMTSKTPDAGVGIIIYDENDSILWMSNRLSFDLPASAAAKNYIIKVINADGTEVLAKNAIDSDDPAILKDALQSAVDASKDYTSLCDDKTVGFYTTESLKTLNTLVAEGQTALNNAAEDQYKTLAKEIGAEIINVSLNAEKNKLKTNYLYTLRNYEFKAKGESSYLSGSNSSAVSDGTAQSSQWLFVPTTSGKYYLQNRASLNLISVIGDNGSFKADAESNANGYEISLVEASNGTFYLEFVNSEGKTKCINETPSWNGIISWSESQGSQWYITEVEEAEGVTDEELSNLLTDTKALLDKAGSITTSVQKLPLQCTDATAPYYIKTNNANTSYPIANLIDNNKATTFATKNGSNYGNFTIDLGAGNEANYLRLSCMTSQEMDGNSPKTIIAMPSTGMTSGFVSKEKTEFTDLPAGTDKQTFYYRDTKEAAQPYRYWRFQVTETNNASTGHPMFELAYIQIRTLVANVTFNDPYTTLSESLFKNTNNTYKSVQTKFASLNSLLSNKGNYQTLKEAYDALLNAMEAIAPTGIESIESAEETTAPLYNLNGQRVNKAQKGIYIIGGKKVLFK